MIKRVRLEKENSKGALVNAQKTEQEYELLKKKYSVYKARVHSLVAAQLELLKDDESDEM